MFILLTYNDFPVYILERRGYKQVILPIGFVIQHDPKFPKIFVRTNDSGLIPLEDLRYFNQNDKPLLKDNPELFSRMVLKEVPNNLNLVLKEKEI